MMRRLITTTSGILLFLSVYCQSDPEFPKGWVVYANAHQGMATNFKYSPDLYVGGIQVVPQVTVVPAHLRFGASAGLVYSGKKFSGLFGPKLSWKISTLNVKQLGSILNLQLEAEHLWGTDKQKLAGGGIKAEIGQLLLTGLTIHREYQFNYWWFQWSVGFNLARKKKNGPDDPLQ